MTLLLTALAAKVRVFRRLKFSYALKGRLRENSYQKTKSRRAARE
jgi:hypothetical protein